MATSCNADASGGLFRQASESVAQAGIVYKQLLGDKGNYLYHTTDAGLVRYDKTTSSRTTLVSNSVGNIIRSSYYDVTNDLLYYVTNDGLQSIKKYNAATSASAGTVGYVSANLTSAELLNLYKNGYLILHGTDVITSTNAFELLGPDFSTSIALFSGLDGYSLENVIQATGQESLPVGAASSTAYPLIVSFVDDNNSSPIYKHYLVTATGVKTEITLNKRIANFFVYSSSLAYILSTDGILYAANTTVDPITTTSMYDSSQATNVNGFVYPIDDGTNIHLITKSSTKSDLPLVFSFPRGTSSGVSTNSVRYGYAEFLDSSNIVDTIVKTVTLPGTTSVVANLLVATDVNGMYEISIKANASDNTTSNGTSSDSEAFTF